MNREQLAHVVRAASTITGHGNVIILGSQAIAGRPKDFDFAEALLGAGLIQVDTLLERAASIDRPSAVIDSVRARINRCAALGDRANRAPRGGDGSEGRR